MPKRENRPGKKPGKKARKQGISGLIDELQRREVFKTLGLYIGICWILIEMSSVMLPAFNAPEWVLRGLIITAFVGFPVAAVLAWIYDITAHGIVVQGEASDTDTDAPALGGLKANFAVIGVLSIALVFSIYLNVTSGPADVEEFDAASIAVLPFVNMSSDPEQEYFSDGVTEELMNLLATIPQFRVAGRTSTFTFKGSDADPQAIGEQLGVNSILAGSVRRGGERVRIAAQLVNVDDGFQLWSDTYDRDLTDVFAVQDEIASAVADGLKVTLLGDTLAGSGQERPVSLDAYNEYLQGLFYFNNAGIEENAISIGYFENAVALQPDYALAWARLGAASGNRAIDTREDPEQHEAALLRMREASAKALELDPNLPEAHSYRGWTLAMWDWDWEAAEASLRRALELRPGHIDAGRGLALVASRFGRVDEALDITRSLIAADPLNEKLQLGYSGYLWQNEDFEESAAVIRRIHELNPSSSFGYGTLAELAMREGRLDEALTLAEASPQASTRWAALAMVYHRLGNREAAIQAQQDLLEAYGNGAAYAQAEIHAFWGEYDEALRWLEIAYDARDASITAMKTSLHLRPLREHPRYLAVLEKMKL